MAQIIYKSFRNDDGRGTDEPKHVRVHARVPFGDGCRSLLDAKNGPKVYEETPPEGIPFPVSAKMINTENNQIYGKMNLAGHWRGLALVDQLQLLAQQFSVLDPHRLDFVPGNCAVLHQFVGIIVHQTSFGVHRFVDQRLREPGIVQLVVPIATPADQVHEYVLAELLSEFKRKFGGEEHILRGFLGLVLIIILDIS